MQRLVVSWLDTVFAVVAAELSQKRHRLLRALSDQFAVDPVQRISKSGSLAFHFGREQVTQRDVEGKPAGVEAPDKPVGIGQVLLLEGGVQHAKRVAVL